MIDNFIEYMWYLFTSPLKKVKKPLNKWYILCRVFGRRLDEAKEDILRARDEGMAATCCPEMLPVHGAERNLTRYAGELAENYRSRIAMYEDICKLGGTNEGVLLAVKTLGYKHPLIMTAKDYCGDMERWAEFYIIIVMDLSEDHPIRYEILKKQVRKIKEVGAKDNYVFCYESTIRPAKRKVTVSERFFMYTFFFPCKKFDGTYYFDGTECFDAVERITKAWMEGDLIAMEYCITKKAKEKMSKARHESGIIPRVKYIALGTGGCDINGNIRPPLEEDISLREEIIRKEYTSYTQTADAGYQYTLRLEADECINAKISEMALIDEEGDCITICCFLPKGKDDTEVTFSIDDVY